MTIPVFKFALAEGLDDSFLPTKATPKDTGWDVRCAEPEGITIKSGEYAKINLGFRILPPEGYWVELKPRSSSFIKKNLHALYGTIDEEFIHTVCFCCQYLPTEISGPFPFVFQKSIKIEFGERIGQIIPIRRQEMIIEKVSNEELDRLDRLRNSIRYGGFGSSGNQ